MCACLCIGTLFLHVRIPAINNVTLTKWTRCSVIKLDSFIFPVNSFFLMKSLMMVHVNIAVLAIVMQLSPVVNSVHEVQYAILDVSRVNDAHLPEKERKDLRPP